MCLKSPLRNHVIESVLCLESRYNSPCANLMYKFLAFRHTHQASLKKIVEYVLRGPERAELYSRHLRRSSPPLRWSFSRRTEADLIGFRRSCGVDNVCRTTRRNLLWLDAAHERAGQGSTLICSRIGPSSGRTTVGTSFWRI